MAAIAAIFFDSLSVIILFLLYFQLLSVSSAYATQVYVRSPGYSDEDDPDLPISKY